MQSTQTLSTNKIIVFVVFICAAIITSLFIFHSHKVSIQPVLSPDIGVLFPVPREIKSFDLITSDKTPFKQKNLYQHWTLLFFGFTHCASACPTTLDMMNRAYTKLQATHPNLQVVLVSLDPDRDTPESLKAYTQLFNSNFIGVTGKIQELRKLQSQLGIYSDRDNSSSTNDYQLQHTSSILLINPQGQWAGLFKFGLKPEQLARGFEDSIKSSS